MSNIKTIFFGTSKFAVPALEALFKAGYTISAVITTPDKASGRGNIPTPSAIKLVAQKLNLLVIQPEKLRNNPEIIRELKQLTPDVAVVAAYGKIIPPEIFNLPAYQTLNLHPSILPLYRGPSPIQYALLNGDKETGITIQKIDQETDHGDIIASEKVMIGGENFEELHDELANLGSNLLIKILPGYIKGEITPKVQDHSKATFTKIIKKEDGKINWNDNSKKIFNTFRAFHQWPGIWTSWNNKILKIADCSNAESNDTKPGTIYEQGDHIYIGCGKGSLEIKRLQLESKKEMAIKDFVLGHPNFIGSLL